MLIYSASLVRPLPEGFLASADNQAWAGQVLIGSRDVRTVALVPGGDLFDEDYLDILGVSLDTFRQEFVGSWMFGYVRALRSAGVNTVLFCVSARVEAPLRFTHEPTGATVCIVPAMRAYRAVRPRMRQLYGLTPHRSTVEQIFGDARGVQRAFLAAIKEAIPYLATPLWTLARELRRQRCDAILCQGYDYGRFDAIVLLGKLMRVPVFATYQGGSDRELGLIERMLRRRALGTCKGLIIAAEAEARRVHLRYRLPFTKMVQLPNPLDLGVWRSVGRDQARAQLGIPTNARVVAWHGRIRIHTKGLDVLLDAWEQLCRERPGEDLRLLLVGTGSDAAELGRRVAHSGVRGIMWVDKFVHDCAELRTYLSAADLYTLPSRSEGFPGAPMEAMACGLPVVATEVQGIPEIIKGGEASGGLIVPREDTRALVQALRRLIDDVPLRHELGRRARKRVESAFSLEAIGEQLRAFLSGREAEQPHALSDGSAQHCRVGEPPLVLKTISPTVGNARTGFNVQPDGQSALSIVADNASPGTLVVMDKELLVTTYGSSGHLTALVPRRLLRRPAKYSVYLTDGVRNSNQIEFVIDAK